MPPEKFPAGAWSNLCRHGATVLRHRRRRSQGDSFSFSLFDGGQSALAEAMGAHLELFGKAAVSEDLHAVFSGRNDADLDQDLRIDLSACFEQFFEVIEVY